MEATRTGITEEIAKFIVDTCYEDFPPDVLQMAKRCIIDGMGVILAGSTEPCVDIVRNYVLSIGGHKESTLLGRGKIRVPVRFAGLVNGTAGHSMDWDDTAMSLLPDRGVLLHPTVPLLAAGLAAGEKLSVSGPALLTAFLVGFEVACKLTESISADHRIRGFHTSGTCGILGAAATVSKLMNLSVEKVRIVLGIAASMSSGLDVNLGTMTKPLHVGRAAENGIVSAQLASLGYDANLEALEGHKGFFQAYGGGFESAKISGRLGQPFSIIEPGISVKSYPSGVVGHGTMDAMRSLVIEHNLRPDEIERIKVSTSSNIIGPKGPLKYRKARTALEAKFCVPFQIASIVLRRKAGMMEFTDEFVMSPEAQEMTDRVETVVDPELDGFGRNRYISRIEVILKNGKILKGQTEEHLRGGPHNPLSRQELAEKFTDCASKALTPRESKELLETIEQLEELGDIHPLINRACA